MIRKSLGLLLVAVLIGAGLSTIAGAAPAQDTVSLASAGDSLDDALEFPQGSPTPSATATPAPSPTSTEQPPKKCPPKKGKGKKKKKGCPPQKAPQAPACPAYTPGELGAEAETSVVTDAHTADAPLEVTVSTEMGFVAVAPNAYQN
ncbi:MAG TPA: hypothetical protein VHJ82_00345, partial [Actinomycetota bacterium]|nr:hypothetical protein [Actinomycetota bacterium]